MHVYKKRNICPNVIFFINEKFNRDLKSLTRESSFFMFTTITTIFFYFSFCYALTNGCVFFIRLTEMNSKEYLEQHEVNLKNKISQ